MEIKIQLPNPDDYQYHGGVTQWFSQMRICLKAAEKTYQEATKGLTEEDEKEEPLYYVDIGVPYELEEKILEIAKEDGSLRTPLMNNLCIRVWSL